MNFKKSQLCSEFLFISLNNLKSVEQKKSNVFVKNILFATPLTVPPGVATPPPATPLIATSHFLSDKTFDKEMNNVFVRCDICL
jgi:hypothetical protein